MVHFRGRIFVTKNRKSLEGKFRLRKTSKNSCFTWIFEVFDQNWPKIGHFFWSKKWLAEGDSSGPIFLRKIGPKWLDQRPIYHFNQRLIKMVNDRPFLAWSFYQFQSHPPKLPKIDLKWSHWSISIFFYLSCQFQPHPSKLVIIDQLMI